MSTPCYLFFFFNDTATTEIYTLSLHDALPICTGCDRRTPCASTRAGPSSPSPSTTAWPAGKSWPGPRAGCTGSGVRAPRGGPTACSFARSPARPARVHGFPLAGGVRRAVAVLGAPVVDDPRTDGGEHAEDDIEPMRFQVDLVQDLPGLDVVQRHVRRFVDLAEHVLDPVDVLFEARLANPPEGHPHPSFVEDHDAAAPPQEGLRLVVDRSEERRV